MWRKHRASCFRYIYVLRKRVIPILSDSKFPSYFLNGDVKSCLVIFKSGRFHCCLFPLWFCNGFQYLFWIFAMKTDRSWFYAWFLTRELRACARAVVDTYDVGKGTCSLARFVDSCKLFSDFRLLSAFDSFWRAINKRMQGFTLK